ncbi:MAG: HEAT repeat domain-containing protein [Methanoregula sp.]|uniref:HEAT repeat domain-containing protein n=1 Tax=Methanoregula sp. TaxID=2052170 RepID=UPI003C3CFABB
MGFPDFFAVKPGDLDRMRDRHDIAGLIRALRSSDFAVQTQAAQALGSLGTAAMDELICALKRKNKNVRLGAIGALAIIRDPRSVAPLTETLRDENLEVRWQAAIALGEIGDERAIGALQAVLRDTDKYVRYGAAFALAKLGWKPETAEERAFFFIGMQEWKAAEAVGPAAIPALSHVLTDHDRAVRRKVIEILGSIGDDRAIPALMQGLADSSSEVRWQAVLEAPKCGIDPMYIPRGLSRRPRTAKNALVAGFLNFVLPGLGYGYIGKWYGIMIFQIDITATVYLYKYEGQGSTYAMLVPLYLLLAIHAWYIAKKMPDF